jgi:hypothetical protein
MGFYVFMGFGGVRLLIYLGIVGGLRPAAPARSPRTPQNVVENDPYQAPRTKLRLFNGPMLHPYTFYSLIHWFHVNVYIIAVIRLHFFYIIGYLD